MSTPMPSERSARITAWPGSAAAEPESLIPTRQPRDSPATDHLLSDYARQHAAQLARFLAIGAALAVLNLGFLHLLRTSLSIPDSVAVAIMYVCGALPHFVAHRWITYHAQDQPVRPQGERYVVMLVCNFLLMQALVALAARLSLSPYLAVMTSTAFTMTFNFLAMTHVVFRRRQESAARHSSGEAHGAHDIALAAELPRELIGILEQRGVMAGSVLVLANRPLGTHLRRAPQFQATRGSVLEAPTLLRERHFSAVVVQLDTLPHSAAEALLARMASLLTPSTLLVIAWPTRVCGAQGWDGAHLALLRSGYERVWPHRGARFWASARIACARAGRTCSIVVPVYNEKDTFPQLMHRLLEKRLDHLGLEREIILVESNSTDGTRELVADFADTPGVRILWEDAPRGKGHAVRTGLAAVTGDIVMIQDADLEYDVNDYDVLLQPLLLDQAAFVLGSRHSGDVPMREFTDQPLLGPILNAAHWFFTGIINVLYGQRLKDPFTMYKVFRRDCLYGLTFECNRFDFDHELVIKLLLKGHQPLEIPVNYRSRSFRQGKKIRFFRDPPTWVAADVRFRLRRLRPKFD